MWAKDSLTVGKLMVRGKMTKGMILNTVFMARRLGLSIPDSAPSWGKKDGDEVGQWFFTITLLLLPFFFWEIRDLSSPPGWKTSFQWRPKAEYKKDLMPSGLQTTACLLSACWALADRPSFSGRWRRRWRRVSEGCGQMSEAREKNGKNKAPAKTITNTLKQQSKVDDNN